MISEVTTKWGGCFTDDSAILIQLKVVMWHCFRWGFSGKEIKMPSQSEKASKYEAPTSTNRVTVNAIKTLETKIFPWHLEKAISITKSKVGIYNIMNQILWKNQLLHHNSFEIKNIYIKTELSIRSRTYVRRSSRNLNF